MREITLNLLRSVFCQTASLHHHLLFNLWQPVNWLCNEIITAYLKQGVMCIFTKPYAKLQFLGLEIPYIPPGHSQFIRFFQSLLLLCACFGDTEKWRAWFFLEEPRSRWRSNRLKLEHGEFWLDIRGKIVTSRVVKPRSRLTKDFVEFLFLEGFKIHLDIGLSNWGV